MKLAKKLRRHVARKKERKNEKYPTRNKHEKNIIQAFIKDRIIEASRKGHVYTSFQCTIKNGGEIIPGTELQINMNDLEEYVKKYRHHIRFVDEEGYETRRNSVKVVHIF